MCRDARFGVALAVLVFAPLARAEPPPTPPVEEVVVRAARKPARATETAVQAAEARRVPGTQGDPLKVVESLPGVARPAFGTGQLVLWGAPPSDTRIYVDGVEIPSLFHGSAIRSTVNGDLVQSIALVPGAYGAEYGRALGGLVSVETRSIPDGTHGYVAADVLDTSALVSARLGDRLRVAAAARYGYLDRVARAVSGRDVGDVFPIPRYADVQAKATLDLREDEELSAVFLGSRDDLTRLLPSLDPAAVRSQTAGSSFERGYLRYVRTAPDGRVVVTPFVGHDRTTVDSAFGGTPARLDVASWRYGIRASHRSTPLSRVAVVVGVDALGSSSDVARDGSLTIPPREGDPSVFGQPPGRDTSSDAFRTSIVDVGPFLFSEIDLGRLTVTPGVRFDAFLVEGSRQTPRVGETPAVGFSRLDVVADPRLSLRYQASRALAFVASGGTYHQAPEPADLSAVFGTPDLTLSRAVHLTAGESVRLTRTLTAELTVYSKSLADLAVRSRLTTPKLARALVQDGEGRVYGVQLLVRQALWRGFFGWASYAISRSERRYYGEASYRLFDYDQPHVASVVASQEIGTWTFGARLRVASGLPRTPVASAFYDAQGDDFQPILGQENSIRLPLFAQLDLRVDKRFTLGSTRLTVYLDALNVTFRKNEEEFIYNHDYTRRGAITGLPALAILGARLDL